MMQITHDNLQAADRHLTAHDNLSYWSIWPLRRAVNAYICKGLDVCEHVTDTSHAQQSLMTG